MSPKYGTVYAPDAKDVFPLALMMPRQRNEEEDIIEVDVLACQGCGSCAAICPNGASVVRGYGDRQVMAMLDAALE